MGLTVLLDSSVCIAYLNGADEAVHEHFWKASRQNLALCSIVKAELLYGARASGRVEHNLERLDVFFEMFSSLPFDDAAANRYGELRAQLRKKGTPIGPNDLFIAAIALTHQLAVATRNTSEFRRVPGLRVLKW